MSDAIKPADQDDSGDARATDALRALALIEAELAQLEHIPAATWNRLHAAFEQVRAAL